MDASSTASPWQPRYCESWPRRPVWKRSVDHWSAGVERISAEYHYVILDFEVTIMDRREPVAGDDAAEARWVLVSDVAELNLVDGLAEFLHDHGIIPTIT